MLNLIIKPHLFDRERRLIINDEIISYDDSDWKRIPSTEFTKGEVSAMRYGVRPIRGYSFYLGRKYYIDIKGIDDKVIKIRLTSLYGIRKKALHNKYTQIVEAYFETHHVDIVNHYLALFNTQTDFIILETIFTAGHIVINKQTIPYEDLGVKVYATYFDLYSKQNPTLYKTYNYLNDWNSTVVYSIAKHILSKKTSI